MRCEYREDIQKQTVVAMRGGVTLTPYKQRLSRRHRAIFSDGAIELATNENAHVNGRSVHGE